MAFHINDNFESINKLKIDKIFMDHYFNLFLKQYKNKFNKQNKDYNQREKQKNEMNWKFIKYHLQKIKNLCQNELLTMYFVFERRFKIDQNHPELNDLSCCHKLIFHKTGTHKNFQILDDTFQKISFGIYSLSNYKSNYGRNIKKDFIIEIPLCCRTNNSTSVELIHAKKKFLRYGFIRFLSFNCIPLECSKIIYKFMFTKKKSKRTLNLYHRFCGYRGW